MNIYISGHKGFLGSRLLNEIKSEHATYVNDLYIAKNNYNCYEKWFSEVKPDVIIHCAAETNVTRCELRRDIADEKNIATTQFLIDVAKNISAFFVFISSDQVYHRALNKGKEDEVCQPENYYGHTKLTSEHAIISNLKKYYILRISMQLGGDIQQFGKNKNQLITKLIRRAKRGDSIFVDRNCFRDYTYVLDIVDAIKNLLSMTLPSGVYNLSSQCELTIADLYRKILFLSNFPINLIEDVIVEKDVDIVYDSRMDCSKINSFSCLLPPTESGIDRCMAEFIGKSGLDS